MEDDKGMFDDILKFPNIALLVMVKKNLHRIFCCSCDVLVAH
jgi:hypothetical protein